MKLVTFILLIMSIPAHAQGIKYAEEDYKLSTKYSDPLVYVYEFTTVKDKSKTCIVVSNFNGLALQCFDKEQK